jgi:hypothetical protein
MPLYAVQVVTRTVQGDGRGGHTVGKLPIFFLDSRTLGIASEAHAEQVVRLALGPILADGISITVTAMNVGEPC